MKHFHYHEVPERWSNLVYMQSGTASLLPFPFHLNVLSQILCSKIMANNFVHIQSLIYSQSHAIKIMETHGTF